MKKIVDYYGNCPMKEGHLAIQRLLNEFDITKRTEEDWFWSALQNISFYKKLNKNEFADIKSIFARLESISKELELCSLDNEEVA